MSRVTLVSFVLLLSFLSPAAHALQFTPATPTGLSAYPPVTAVAVSAAEPQVVYAAAGGKLFRSSDAAATWTTLTVPSATIDELAVDPSNSAIVYVVGRQHTYRSDDSGATWKDLTPRLGTVSTLGISIDPQEPSTVYIGARCGSMFEVTKGGVFKSTDRGDTWSHLSPSVTCVDFLSLDPAAPQRLFATTASGSQYRTDDAGRTWQQTSGELPIFDVIADPLDPSRHYGLGRGVPPTSVLHFLVSTNSGATWFRVASEGLPNGGQQLAVDPTTRRLFLLGQSLGLYVSDDLGLHWKHVDAVPSVTATSLEMAVAGDVIYVATSRGLYRVPMSEPESATAVHPGEAAPLRVGVYRIAVDPNDPSVVYATAFEGGGILDAYRVFRSIDAGQTWERITADDDIAWRMFIAVDAIGDLYAVNGNTMWRFAKATQTWESWTAPELVPPTILLANPQRPGWLYAANTGRASYSIDGGHTWTRINAVTSGFWSLSIAPNGSDLLGGNNDGAFASADGGVTWRALPAVRLVTKTVAIAPSRPQTMYRLSNTASGGLISGLFRSDDGGNTWSALRWPGEREIIFAPITVDPRDDRSVWIGLAHSTDGGMTWTVEPSNAKEIDSVIFNSDGSVVYARGRDFQIWRTTLRGPRRRAVR